MGNWASHAIEQLAKGENVRVTPHGHSMKPRVNSGDTVELAPHAGEIKVGQIVLVKVNGKVYLHLVTAVRGKQYQISNNHGHINGWVTRDKIFGVAISVKSK